MSVENEQNRLDSMGEQEGASESSDKRIALGEKDEKQTEALTNAYIDSTNKVLQELNSPNIDEEMRGVMMANIKEFLALLNENKDVKKEMDNYLALLDGLMEEVEETKHIREFFQKDLYKGVLSVFGVVDQLDVKQIADVYLAGDKSRRVPLEIIADNFGRLVEVQNLSGQAPEIIQGSKAEISLALGCFINGYQAEGEAKIQGIVRKIEMSRDAEELTEEIGEQEVLINEALKQYLASCDELKAYFEKPVEEQDAKTLLKLYEKQSLEMYGYVSAMEGVVAMGEEFVSKDPGFAEERLQAFSEMVYSQNLQFFNVKMYPSQIPNIHKTVASLGVGGVADSEARELSEFVTEVRIEIDRKPFPLNREGYEHLKMQMEDALLSARRNIYVQTGDANYKKYFDESQQKSFDKFVKEGNVAVDLAQESDKEELGEEKMRPELYVAAKSKAASLAQAMKNICDLQGTDPMAAYKKGVELKRELGWWSSKLGLDLMPAEEFAGVFVNAGPGILAPGTFIEGLNDAPQLKLFFSGIISTYGEMIEGLLPDILNKNPLIYKFKEDFKKLRMQSRPFMGSVQNLVQMVERGEEPSAHFIEKFVHPDAQAALSNPLIGELKSSPVVGWLHELGVLGVSGDMAVGALGVEGRDLGGVEGAVMSGIGSDTVNMFHFVQGLEKTAQEALKISGERSGLGGYSIDALIFAGKLLLAVGGAVAMTAAFPAAGAVGMAVASGFGSSFGSALGGVIFDDDASGFQPVNFAQNWAMGAAFTWGAGVSGRFLGGKWGNVQLRMSEKVENALLRSNSPFARRILGVLKKDFDRIMNREITRISASGVPKEGIFKHVLTEYKEELSEELFEAFGRGMVADNPVVGFLFMLIPSTTSVGRAKFIAGKGSFSPVSGVSGRVSGNGVSLQYDPAKKAELRQYLVQRGAPAEVLTQFDAKGSVDFQQEGVSLVVREEQALDIRNLLEGNEELGLVFNEELGFYECAAGKVLDFIVFVESHGYMIVRGKGGEVFVRGLQDTEGVRVVLGEEEEGVTRIRGRDLEKSVGFRVGKWVSRVWPDGKMLEGEVKAIESDPDNPEVRFVRVKKLDGTEVVVAESVLLEETVSKSVLSNFTNPDYPSLEFFEKRELMAHAFRRAFSEITPEQLLEMDIDQIMDRITEGISLTASQVDLIRKRVEVVRQDMKIVKEAKDALGSREGRVAFAMKYLGKNSVPLDDDVEIRLGQGLSPSTIVVIFSMRDFARISKGEKKKWEELTLEERDMLVTYSAGGFNPDRNPSLVFISRRKVSDPKTGVLDERILSQVVKHEEIHYLNKIFQHRDGFKMHQEKAKEAFAAGNYVEYLNHKAEAAMNLAHDEITAYWISGELSMFDVLTLAPAYGGHYMWTFDVMETEVRRLEIAQQEKANLLGLIGALRTRHIQFLNHILNIENYPGFISKFPNGDTLLMLTPIEQWGNLRIYLTEKYFPEGKVFRVPAKFSKSGKVDNDWRVQEVSEITGVAVLVGKDKERISVPISELIEFNSNDIAEVDSTETQLTEEEIQDVSIRREVVGQIDIELRGDEQTGNYVIIIGEAKSDAERMRVSFHTDLVKAKDIFRFAYQKAQFPFYDTKMIFEKVGEYLEQQKVSITVMKSTDAIVSAVPGESTGMTIPQSGQLAGPLEAASVPAIGVMAEESVETEAEKKTRVEASLQAFIKKGGRPNYRDYNIDVNDLATVKIVIDSIARGAKSDDLHTLYSKIAFLHDWPVEKWGGRFHAAGIWEHSDLHKDMRKALIERLLKEKPEGRDFMYILNHLAHEGHVKKVIGRPLSVEDVPVERRRELLSSLQETAG